MKKTILPTKKEVSFGSASVKAVHAATQGNAKATVLGTSKPKLTPAPRTVKGKPVVKAYKTSTLGK